jgi:biopolymer transport protein ExbD
MIAPNKMWMFESKTKYSDLFLASISYGISEPILKLRVDRNCKFEYVNKLMLTLAENGFEKVSFLYHQ